jgi:hypothetical protein
MRKIDEVLQPSSCLSKAYPQEMMFVLLSRDQAAPHAIREWISERLRLGKNLSDDPQITEALQCAEAMEREREVVRNPSAYRIDPGELQLQARADHMWRLIRRFVECDASRDAYAELKGSQSMDIPVEFLALCEFAEEMGVKLP